MVVSPSLTCRSTRVEKVPQFVGPIVGIDGSGYLLVRQYVGAATGSCVDSEPNLPFVLDHGVTLLRLSPTGLVSTDVLLAEHCSLQSQQCDAAAVLKQLLPDLLGGTLATWFHTHQGAIGEMTLTHISADDVRIDRIVPGSTFISMIGDAGTAYGYNNGVRAAFDLATGSSKFTLLGEPVMALDLGGVMIPDGATLKWQDEDGVLQVTSPMAADFTASVTKQGEMMSILTKIPLTRGNQLMPLARTRSSRASHFKPVQGTLRSH